MVFQLLLSNFKKIGKFSSYYFLSFFKLFTPVALWWPLMMMIISWCNWVLFSLLVFRLSHKDSDYIIIRSDRTSRRASVTESVSMLKIPTL